MVAAEGARSFGELTHLVAGALRVSDASGTRAPALVAELWADGVPALEGVAGP
jgi:hypothetical protein